MVIWLTAPLIVVLLVCATYVGRHSISNQLNQWSLLPKPERLTELYFSDSNTLPKTYTSGQKQNASFTVHDIEYRTTKYYYTVDQSSGDGKTGLVLAHGSFTLSQNLSKAFKIPITLVNQGGRSQVEVNLAYDGIVFGANNLSQESESISYLVNEVGAQQ